MLAGSVKEKKRGKSLIRFQRSNQKIPRDTSVETDQRTNTLSRAK